VKRQRGVALLIALLVVALATILIAGLLDRGGLAAARTRNQLRELQAENYAKGLEDYAARVLWQDNVTGDGVDASDDMWAVPLPPTPVPGGNITATMTDLDGRFNLNNLSDESGIPDESGRAEAWQQKFALLLQALKLDRNLAQNVRDWMNTDPGSGAGEGWYAGQAVPYRPGHRQFAHVSELRMVEGFDGDTYARILPHVSALPAGTTININTATVPVLMTLVDGMTEQVAAAIWQQGHAHFKGLNDLQTSPYNIAAVPPGFYDVQSQFFLARGDITLDSLPFTFYSLIQRSLGKGSATDGGILVLQRSRGGE
jgi:general secretion pathway protein K